MAREQYLGPPIITARSRSRIAAGTATLAPSFGVRVTYEAGGESVVGAGDRRAVAERRQARVYASLQACMLVSEPWFIFIHKAQPKPWFINKAQP